MPSIRAPFTISTRPGSLAPEAEVPVVAGTTFDKVFVEGALIGTSVAQMVSVVGPEGPLAYVALERVDGLLEGRRGAFVLLHIGAVSGGIPSLELEIVPGSGTQELVGISGAGSIEHTAAGAHLDLDYALPG
jgi:hypothetical protein